MTDQYLRLDGRNIGERWCIIDAMKTYDAPQIRTRAGEIENAFAAEAETNCGRPLRIDFRQCFQLRQRAMQAITQQCTVGVRSEEHPYELQSLMRISYAVFCLKKKKQN